MRRHSTPLFYLLFLFFIAGCTFLSNQPAPSNAILIESPVEPPASSNEPTIPSPATAVLTSTPFCSDGLLISNTAQNVPKYQLQIIQTYPHDQNAFTQGLVFHDGQLYEGTGLRGQSTVRLVELESGHVQKQVGIDASEFGEGTAVLNNKLYQLTWQSQKGYIYDLENLAPIGTFNYTGDGWGLTTNGQCLIMSNGSSQITYRDPQTFEILGTLIVKEGEKEIHLLNELEYINGEIWANIYSSPFIVRIDPETGQVLGWIDGSPLVKMVQPRNSEAVLNGIAYDAENGRIFLTGKLWQTLFEVQLIQN